MDEITGKNHIPLIIASLSERRRAALICLCENASNKFIVSPLLFLSERVPMSRLPILAGHKWTLSRLPKAPLSAYKKQSCPQLINKMSRRSWGRGLTRILLFCRPSKEEGVCWWPLRLYVACVAKSSSIAWKEAIRWATIMGNRPNKILTAQLVVCFPINYSLGWLRYAYCMHAKL